MQSLVESPSGHRLAPIGGPVTEPPEFSGFSLTALIGALRRHKALIVITIIVTNVLVFGLIELLPARYTATTVLQIKQADTPALVAKPVANGLPAWMPGDNAEMATQVDILRARAPLAHVVETLGLADDPEFQSRFARLVRTASALMRYWLPASWQTALPWQEDTETPAEREETATQHLQRALSVMQVAGSHVIQVSVTASDPAKAAHIANAVVKQYLDDQIVAKYQTTNLALQWASKQATAQRQQLIAAENSAVDYMAAHKLTANNGFAPPSEAPPGRSTFGGLAGQQLFSLQDGLAAARAELAAKQARVAELDALRARHANFASLPEVSNSPVIAELERADAALRVQEAHMVNTYGPGAQALQLMKATRASISQHMAAEIDGIAQHIRNDAAAANEQVERLEQTLDRGRRKYIDAERASVDLRELTRDVAAKRTLYDKLLMQVSEISQQLALAQADAAIVSPAAPPTRPSFPNKLVFGGIGAIASLLAGVIVTALVEHGDKTLRSGPQAEQSLGLISLGLVPLVERRSWKGALHAIVARQPASLYAAAIRGIFTQLLHGGTGVVLVTSAVPQEGKTVTALSLAMAATRSGRRTAVIDLDFRRPSVAREASLRVGAGVTEFMSGAASFDTIVYPDPIDSRLHIIPLCKSLARADDPPSSQDLQRLIETARDRYECIFLDMPPSLAISEIQQVAACADAALFIVKWGSTSYPAALNGLKSLCRIGVPFSGFALTQVDLKRHALYGYEQFGEYHKRYLEYFNQQSS